MNSIQTAKLMRVTLRQLEWWSQKDLVRPKMFAAKNGMSRDYDGEDLMKVGVVAELRDKGMLLQRVKGVVNRVAINMHYMVTDGQRVKHSTNAAYAVDLARKFPGPVHIVDLGEIRKKIEKAKE